MALVWWNISDENRKCENYFKWSKLSLKTYNDHRMAMSFAPLAMLNPVTIENPEVVTKSYPQFWNDIKQVGFEMLDS